MGRSRSAVSMLPRPGAPYPGTKRPTANAAPFLPILPKNESPTPSDLGYSSPPRVDAKNLSPTSLLHPGHNPVASTPLSSTFSSNAIESTLKNTIQNNIQRSLQGQNALPASLQTTLQNTIQNNIQSTIQNNLQNSLHNNLQNTIQNNIQSLTHSLQQGFSQYHPLNSLILAAQLHPQLSSLPPIPPLLSLPLHHSTVGQNQEIECGDSDSKDRREEAVVDDEDEEPGELVIKEDPMDEDVENFERRYEEKSVDLSTQREEKYSPRTDETVNAFTDARLDFPHHLAEKFLPGSSSFGPGFLPYPPSITSLQSVLNNVNSDITRHQFEQTVASASTSALLSSATLSSDLRCLLCGWFSSTRLEALTHARKLCPSLPQVSSAQEGLQDALISGLASKIKRISSSDLQSQLLSQQISSSNRGPSNLFREDESGPETDNSVSSMALDSEDNSRDGRKTRSRSHIRGEHLDVLRPIYYRNPRPKKEEINAIADRLGFSSRVVQVWFQNARARERREGRPVPPNSHDSFGNSLAYNSGNDSQDIDVHSVSSSTANTALPINSSSLSVSPWATSHVEAPKSFDSQLYAVRGKSNASELLASTLQSSARMQSNNSSLPFDSSDSMPLDLSTKRATSPQVASLPSYSSASIPVTQAATSPLACSTSPCSQPTDQTSIVSSKPSKVEASVTSVLDTSTVAGILRSCVTGIPANLRPSHLPTTQAAQSSLAAVKREPDCIVTSAPSPLSLASNSSPNSPKNYDSTLSMAQENNSSTDSLVSVKLEKPVVNSVIASTSNGIIATTSISTLSPASAPQSPLHNGGRYSCHVDVSSVPANGGDPKTGGFMASVSSEDSTSSPRSLLPNVSISPQCKLAQILQGAKINLPSLYAPENLNPAEKRLQVCK